VKHKSASWQICWSQERTLSDNIRTPCTNSKFWWCWTISRTLNPDTSSSWVTTLASRPRTSCWCWPSWPTKDEPGGQLQTPSWTERRK
jgi:hypothetical protein